MGVRALRLNWAQRRVLLLLLVTGVIGLAIWHLPFNREVWGPCRPENVNESCRGPMDMRSETNIRFGRQLAVGAALAVPGAIALFWRRSDESVPPNSRLQPTTARRDADSES